MATKRKTTPTQQTQPERLLRIVVDYVINPLSDTPFSGLVTRSELDAAGVDVDALLARGMLEETDRVRETA